GIVALRTPLQELGRVRVGLVQASIRQDEKWDPRLAWRNIDHHLNLTREAAARGARLVIWPESSLPFLFDRNPPIARELGELAQGKNIYLLFGNDDRDDQPGGGYTIMVGAKMLRPDGGVGFRYHKIRLVPFGEFVPMEGLLHLIGAQKLVKE